MSLFSYTLSEFYNKRQSLAEIYRQTPRRYPTLHIHPTELKQQGIEVFILDFDGVLAEYGASQPQLNSWLTECVTVFGADHVFILSNRPSPDRIEYFKQHFAGVRFIEVPRKKPYPEGLEKIMQLTQKPPEKLVLVDDRLLTGVLAACIAKTQVIYITDPYINFSKHPIAELFFISLRLLERLIIQGYCFVNKKKS